jgi:biopolymer transport protein ExbD
LSETLDPQRAHRLRALRALAADGHTAELPALKADINVTPLVDVVLVLLIIFMVVTPLIASGVVVDLPRTLHHSRKPDEGKDIIVSITHDEHLYLGAVRVSRVEELVRGVLAERRKFPEKTLFLKGDARVPYGVMRQAIEALHEAGIEDMILGTQELGSATQ